MYLEELTKQVLGACFEVSNELGIGFLESVYQKALVLALENKNISVQSEVPIKVYFRDNCVGEFYADLLVANELIIELKAVKGLAVEHHAQVLNYLRATGYPVGLLVNFGTKKLEYRRFNNRIEKT